MNCAMMMPMAQTKKIQGIKLAIVASPNYFFFVKKILLFYSRGALRQF